MQINGKYKEVMTQEASGKERGRQRGRKGERGCGGEGERTADD